MPSTRLSSKSVTKGAGSSASCSVAQTMPSCANKKIACEICGRSFQREGVLSRHRSLHAKETASVQPLVKSETLPCNACGKVFKNTGTLGRHRCKNLSKESKLTNVETVSKTRDVSRSSKFLNKRQLHKSVRASKSIPVQISSSFKPESALLVDTENTSQKPDVIIGVSSRSSSRIESKKSASESMNKILTDNSTLKIKGASKNLVMKSKPDVKKPAALTTTHGESKIRKSKGIKQVERYSCKVCNKTFGCETRLEKHETLHDSSKPFSCDVCGKFFDDIRFVKTHKTLHEKKSRKECDVCGKVFNERIFFDIHCLTHVEQKPFRCDICEDIFKDKSSYMRHCKGHKARTKKVAERFLSMKEVLKQKLEDSNRPS
ncbi:hypothetical protein JTE90_012108 [Oedothorax gibbosus]|uniref:C2H2-type domain-containing protein n=1 Tax=Oedothorax gibbosus TaxID=931172 RepID=A0AAV6UX98_9ARAC|nr:hypothetical protein JTE90_012108 [Oedothorax gibbosus]